MPKNPRKSSKLERKKSSKWISNKTNFSRFSRNFIGSRPKHSSIFSKMDASKKPKITGFFARAKHIFLASLRELCKIVYTFVFLGSFALLNFLVHFYVIILFYYIKKIYFFISYSFYFFLNNLRLEIVLNGANSHISFVRLLARVKHLSKVAPYLSIKGG